METSLSLRKLSMAFALALAGCAVSNPDATPAGGAASAAAPDPARAATEPAAAPRRDLVVDLAAGSKSAGSAAARDADGAGTRADSRTAPAASTAPLKPVSQLSSSPVADCLRALQDDGGMEAQPASGAAALDAYQEGSRAQAPVAFHEAVARAADQLMAQARCTIGTEPRRLVIDPLVDGKTGQQTASTVEMGKILAELIEKKYPSLKPAMLTRVALAEDPILFIGTLTPYNTSNSERKPANAFRVWLTLIDLRTGRIVAKSLDKATAASVDAVPLSFYRDSPTWPKDRTVTAYIESCKFGSKVGDPADPHYISKLPAAAAINEALLSYASGQMEDSNRLFHEAAALADGDDLRIENGLYLTSWNLGRTEEARGAFDQIVASGLKAHHLNMKFLFTPSQTTLLEEGDLSAQYGMWLRELAQLTAHEGACLNVVGHTSKTGTAAVNDPLSFARASRVRELLATGVPGLSNRLTAMGRGSRENLIGLGTDDLRDALDRRVELIVRNCSA